MAGAADRTRAAILAITAVLPLLTPLGATAQVLPGEPADGFLEPPSVATAVFSECATPLQVEVLAQVVDLGCSVIDSTRIEEAVPTAWMLRYERRATIDYDDFVDSLVIDEFVLVQRRADAFHVVWHLPQITTYTFLRELTVARHHDAVLVSYFICLNGTGGCAQQFLVANPRWSVVDQPYLEGLVARLPAEGSLHKGRRIDVATLQGVQPVAMPGDANCCPSARMTFAVELDGSELRLTRATMIPSGASRMVRLPATLLTDTPAPADRPAPGVDRRRP